jgi:hypothetical protein
LFKPAPNPEPFSSFTRSQTGHKSNLAEGIY